MAHNLPINEATPGLATGPDAEEAGSWSMGVVGGRLVGSILPSSERDGSRSADRRGVMVTLFRLLPMLVAAIAGIVLVAAVGLFVFRAMYDGRIYPAVIVGDVPVGGLTIDEAEAALVDRATALEAGTVSFTYGGQTWTPTLAELGVTVDLEGSLAQAEALGRSGDAATRLAAARELLQADQVVPLRTELNPQVLATWFDRVDADLGQPAVNAEVVVEGTTVTVSPEVPGLAVDRATATGVITRALGSLEPVAMDLPTSVAEPEIKASDLEAAKAYVAGAVGTNLRLTFEGRSWRLSAESLVPYVTVETVMIDGRPQAQLALDKTALAAELRSLYSDEINREPVDARVAWSNEHGLIALDPSQTGITLKAGDFARAVESAFLGDDKTVEIPVVEVRPEIDDENLAALKIETQLGRGDSNYEGGSWQRDENIKVGVERLNGTLVPPGEDFSFNGAIGAIIPENGFVEASVVVAERVGTDYGGGICQVSTTVFRAALLAGMPIGEWHPHTYRLQGYERDGWGPGFDASILQWTSDPVTGADFTFTNFTDGWLLVEAWTDWPYVIVNIYGPDTGNTVEVVDHWQSDPIVNNEDVEVFTSDLPAGQRQQTEWPMAGLETAFTRVIYDENGEVVGERQFYTYFQGRGNVYEVGTG